MIKESTHPGLTPTFWHRQLQGHRAEILQLKGRLVKALPRNTDHEVLASLLRFENRFAAMERQIITIGQSSQPAYPTIILSTDIAFTRYEFNRFMDKLPESINN